MLLIDPTEASTAIGVKCNGQQPGADNAQLILVLNYITPRVEDALNVASLIRGAFVDSFYLTGMNARSERPIARLRLSQGFLTTDAITITDMDGLEIDPEAIELTDLEHGVIELNTWEKGRLSVAYTSGFEPTAMPVPVPEGFEADRRVLQNVPDWIKGLVITLLVNWFRTTLVSPKLPQNVNLEALDRMLRKEIYLRVYGRYMRPRVNCFFSERLSNGA